MALEDPNQPAWLNDHVTVSHQPVLNNPMAMGMSMSPGMGMGLAMGLGGTSEGGDASQRRRRKRRGYDTDDEDSMEDCCCCPLDPCLAAFFFFHCIAGLLGVSSMAANAYHLTNKLSQQVAPPNIYIDGVLRGYSIIMGCIIVCCETDWKFLMRRLKLLDLWVFRGLFYSYVGLTTLDMYSPTVYTSPECIIGFSLIVVGILYIVMGSLCLKSVAARMRSNYKEIPDENVTYESV